MSEREEVMLAELGRLTLKLANLPDAHGSVRIRVTELAGPEAIAEGVMWYALVTALAPNADGSIKVNGEVVSNG